MEPETTTEAIKTGEATELNYDDLSKDELEAMLYAIEEGSTVGDANAVKAAIAKKSA